MKNVLRIGIILLIIGMMGATITSFTAKDDLEKNLSSETFIYEKNEFTDIDISVVNNPVIVLPSEDDKIKVVIVYESYETLTEEKTDNKLSITVKSKWFESFFNGFSMFNLSDFLLERTVYIYLPDLAYDLDIKTSNGIVTVKDVSLRNGTLKSSNGSINISNSMFATLGAHTSNGTIDLSNVNAQKADLEISNGRLKLNSINISELIGNSSNGQILGSKITSDSVHLVTSNGYIKISVIGTFDDYKLTTKTSNGKVKINGTTYGNDTYHKDKTPSVVVRTSNGNIDVNFSLDLS